MSVIVRRNLHTNMRLILNGYRATAVESPGLTRVSFFFLRLGEERNLRKKRGCRDE